MLKMGLFLMLGVLSACVATNSTSERIPFPEAEYSALRTDGNGAISGQVYIEAKGGERVVKQGAKVVLNPVTSYSRQWYETTAVMKHHLAPPDAKILVYIKETVTDAEGRFEMRDIPAGEYFLSSGVVWESPKQLRSLAPMSPQGRFLVQRITVHKNEKLEVALKCCLRRDSGSLDATKPSDEKVQAWTAWIF